MIVYGEKLKQGNTLNQSKNKINVDNCKEKVKEENRMMVLQICMHDFNNKKLKTKESYLQMKQITKQKRN